MIPKRPLRPSNASNTNDSLPLEVSIVGLGCSSFSSFFSKDTSKDSSSFTAANLKRSHPVVQEWIETIRYAVKKAGITLLDTAPWYGHGTSEIVIGWALEDLSLDRDTIMINTKIGRYEANPSKQFDFSRDMTLRSVQRSLDRMQCMYINILQLHDPEFAPSLNQLLDETIPAMLECQARGWCRGLGMTGYPLEVQQLLLEQSYQKFGRNIWDQSLTYAHYNLHDSTLFSEPISSYSSFADFCQRTKVPVLSAAPLSMGLLTHEGPPDWHPASDELKTACRNAAAICQKHGVDIANLALIFAMTEPRIPCTVLGMKDVDQVKNVEAVAKRISSAEDTPLLQILSQEEQTVFTILLDTETGPFANVVKTKQHYWDGVGEARAFWKARGVESIPDWHSTHIASTNG